MKRTFVYSTMFAVLLSLSGFPLMAQNRGGGPGANPGTGQEPGVAQPHGMGQRTPGEPMGRQPGMEPPVRGRIGTNTIPHRTMMHRKSPAELLSQNTRLTHKLQTLLPAGENVTEAASGFKNLGKFVAALHVSHNLNIPFTQVKGKVTSGDSLGKTVHTLNPNLSKKEVKSQVKKAKRQAKADIKASHK